MSIRRSIVNLLAWGAALGLLGVVLCGAASAALIPTVVPVTFTLPEPETVTMQIVCTHSGSSSTSWDRYTNNPTLSGTLSANLTLNLNQLGGHVDITGIQWTDGNPGGLVFSDYTRRIEGVATMNMMNLHASLSSFGTVIAVNGDAYDNTAIKLVLNAGIISWNASPGTRQLTASPLSCPLIGTAGNSQQSFLSIGSSTGTPDLIQGGYATYSVELWQNINSTLSGTILTIKYLGTTYNGGIRTDGSEWAHDNPGYIDAAGKFVLGGDGHPISPEPTTLAMLLGLAVALTGYGWWRRRRSRT